MDKNKLSKLTEREIQVLKLFKRGYSNVEIAKKLKVTIHTVKKQHMWSIYKKLGLRGATDPSCGQKSRLLMSKLCGCKI